MAKRAHYLFVCTNRRPDGNPKGSCAQSGSEDIHRALKDEILRRGMAATEVRACTSSCIDVCEHGPVIAVEPDDLFYGHVNVSDVPEIVDAIARGVRVDRLVVEPHAFGPAKEPLLKLR